MTEFQPRLHGLVPPGLQPKTRRMMLEDFELPPDIGFHDFEIGNPQRLLVTIEVWLDEASFASSAHMARAWKFGFLRLTLLDLDHGHKVRNRACTGNSCHHRI